MYEIAVTPGTDEKYADVIDDLNTRYKAYMKKGVINLQEAGKVIGKLEQQYDLTNLEMEKLKSHIIGAINE